MARFKNYDWNLPEGKTPGSAADWDAVRTAVLMDIRDQLFKLNRVFECPNALAIPGYLREIRNDMRHVRKNTTKTRRRRAK